LPEASSFCTSRTQHTTATSLPSIFTTGEASVVVTCDAPFGFAAARSK